MRHRRAGYRLGRTTAHRLSTLRNLAIALFQHGQIVTTEQKAKCVQPFVEKIVTLAKRGDNQHVRRSIAGKLGRDRKVFDWIYLPKTPTERVQKVKLRDEEVLTTREKKVDCAKARRDLKHKTTVTLEDGIAQTIAWMRDVYKVK